MVQTHATKLVLTAASALNHATATIRYLSALHTLGRATYLDRARRFHIIATRIFISSSIADIADITDVTCLTDINPAIIRLSRIIVIITGIQRIFGRTNPIDTRMTIGALAGRNATSTRRRAAGRGVFTPRQ